MAEMNRIVDKEFISLSTIHLCHMARYGRDERAKIFDLKFQFLKNEIIFFLN
jgi:hypothetical protein